ncbi:MAG: efflux RND transporter periplasmic adaptor subunit [Verrucomicrobiota bacterium]
MSRKEVVREHLGFLVGAALLSGAFYAGGCGRAQQAPPSSVPEVAAVTVRQEAVVLTTELPGRAVPYLVAEIRPQVGGLIQKRVFPEGSEVRAGQALYLIDPAPFQAAYQNAMAALGKAEANLPAIRLRFDRYKDLLADRAVSQQDFDDAAAALKQAEADIEYWKASVETARINLGYTRVIAPISGRIGRSAVTDGALVTASQPVALATIQQLDPIYVDIPQSTAELLRLRNRLKEGRLRPDGADQKRVGLLLEDGTRYASEGRLEFQDVTVDPTTGSVVLRAVFPNPKGVLLPGMFVRAVLKEGVNRQAILVPQQAVSRDPKGNPTALIVNADGKVELRMLTVERAIGDRWLVSSGLAPGDRVIAEGVQKVRPGVSVKVVPFDAAKSN